MELDYSLQFFKEEGKCANVDYIWQLLLKAKSPFTTQLVDSVQTTKDSRSSVLKNEETVLKNKKAKK